MGNTWSNALATAKLERWAAQFDSRARLPLGESSLYHPNTIKMFARVGNAQDLYKLRQMSELYFDILNPTYLDSLGLRLKIDLALRPALDIDIPGYLHKKFILTDPRPEVYSSWKSWNPQLAKMIRELWLADVFVLEIYEDFIVTVLGKEMTIKELISQVSPTITKFHLNNLLSAMDMDIQKPGKDFLKYLMQFENLKELSIGIEGSKYFVSSHLDVYDEIHSTAFQNLLLKNIKIYYLIPKDADQLDVQCTKYLARLTPQVKIRRTPDDDRRSIMIRAPPQDRCHWIAIPGNILRRIWTAATGLEVRAYLNRLR